MKYKSLFFSMLCLAVVANALPPENLIDERSSQKFRLSSGYESPASMDLSEKTADRRILPFIKGSAYYGVYPTLGAGVSIRNKSLSVDPSVEVGFFTTSAACSASKLFFFSSSYEKGYTSIGLGGILTSISIYGGFRRANAAAGIIAPLRIGYEGNKYLVDGGIVLGFLPSLLGAPLPLISAEIRSGIKF